MKIIVPLLFTVTLSFLSIDTKAFSCSFISYPTRHLPSTRLFLSATSNDDGLNNDCDDDYAEPGTMRVAEIKSELDLRGVNYSDCFDKESLAQKLVQARASGTADPSIIDQFNKQRQKEHGPMEIDDDILKKATGGDGTLPGGMPPDMLKQLMGNPEVMELMNNPKMQQVMKIMMTGGRDAIEIAMIEDKEIYELVTKLNDVMTKAM